MKLPYVLLDSGVNIRAKMLFRTLVSHYFMLIMRGVQHMVETTTENNEKVCLINPIADSSVKYKKKSDERPDILTFCVD